MMGHTELYNRLGPEFWAKFAESERKNAATIAVLSDAELRANARAAAILSHQQCPADLIEWSARHGIPTFAEMIWQAGFMAAFRLLELERDAARGTGAEGGAS